MVNIRIEITIVITVTNIIKRLSEKKSFPIRKSCNFEIGVFVETN